MHHTSAALRSVLYPRPRLCPTTTYHTFSSLAARPAQQEEEEIHCAGGRTDRGHRAKGLHGGNPSC